MLLLFITCDLCVCVCLTGNGKLANKHMEKDNFLLNKQLLFPNDLRASFIPREEGL